MSFGESSLNLLIILSLCQGGNSDCSHLGDHGFECQDKNHSCVLIYHVCDGEADCPDGSDELWYDNMTSTQKERGFRCPSGCYLPKEYVCDQYNHCNEDECNCGYSNPIRCSKDGACINENFFCDGYGGACPNNEDELLYHESMKGRNEYLKCWAGKLQGACALLYERHKCNGIKDCVHGGDECFCKDNDTNTIIDHECFRCLNGHGEMVQSHLCNGFFDCSDLSDECLCENPPSTCKQLKFQDDCEFQCQLPNDGENGNVTKCINITQVCDRSKDCFYGEDEKYCFPVSVWKDRISNLYADAELPELWCCSAGYPANCLNESVYSNSSYDGCDQFYKCPADHLVEYFKYAIKCDGVAMCRSIEEECEDCNTELIPRHCNQRFSGLGCPETNNTIFIERNAICNGLADCNKLAANASSDEQNCVNRFYCTSTSEKKTFISITKTKVCNCINDCDDGSDEKSCSNFTQFCCLDRKQAVKYEKICDGIDDCFDRSDECQNCIQSPFADDKYLIRNKVFTALVWIIGIISIFGNGFVLIRTTVKLRQENLSVHVMITMSQVLVLSLADLCVGIYLISLGIANAVYSGTYCYEDFDWRGGSACSSLGVLCMFGMQASVFTLTTMTISRLVIAYRPFHPAVYFRHVSCTIILAFVAVILAIVPILPWTQDYFISHVKLTRNPFLEKQVTRHQLSQFANKLTYYSSGEHDYVELLGKRKDSYSWTSLYRVLKHLNESFEPLHEFGYYSAHGVCLPKFFPTTTDSAWQYSFFLIFIDFLSFFVIAISSILIIRIPVSRQKNALVENQTPNESVQLQRRITRIIATDFLCWMPICLIAFIKLSGFVV